VDVNVSRPAAVAGRTNILRSTQLVGTFVSVQDNRRIGKITEIVFNDGGCISHVIVDINGRFAPIPWHVGHFDHQHRMFMLDSFDVARLQRIPTFTRFEQFADPAFVSQVNQFFGVRDTDVNVRTDRSLRATERDATRGSREVDVRSTRDPQRDADQPRERSPQVDRPREGAADQPRPEGTRSDTVPPPAPRSGSAAPQGSASPGASPANDDPARAGASEQPETKAADPLPATSPRN
jgi:hypothetical protein